MTPSVRIFGTAIGLTVAIAAAWLGVHARRANAFQHPILPFATVRPVLEEFANDLPAELRQPNESKWNAWAQREDAAIRARLDQGEQDSMINLLLFGTSFTDKPRARGILEPDDPLLQSRLNDFLRGVRDPRGNERLACGRRHLDRIGVRLDGPGGDQQAKDLILQTLRRVRNEHIAFRHRFDDPASESGVSEGSGVFHDRGIALDTKILVSCGIDTALRDMKARGAVGEGSISRIAVIGPGLDFADKGFGYDYYPLQTLQPFAVYDSLVRLGLAPAGKIDIVAFDISAEVLDHLRRAHQRARAGEGYVLQLPRELRPWVSDPIEYWRSFGSTIGEPVAPIPPPPVLNGLETRAVRIRPQVVMSCQPVDLNFVVEQVDRRTKQQFDLVIATNIFVYYDSLEQALALENISTFLKPGGFLLTNDWLQGLPEIPMHEVQSTRVRYGEGEFERDNIHWWQRN